MTKSECPETVDPQLSWTVLFARLEVENVGFRLYQSHPDDPPNQLRASLHGHDITLTMKSPGATAGWKSAETNLDLTQLQLDGWRYRYGMEAHKKRAYEELVSPEIETGFSVVTILFHRYTRTGESSVRLETATRAV